MAPEEIKTLIDAAPGIAKGVAALGVVVPFASIVNRMLGPAADEVAEMLRDKVRLYRHKNKIEVLEKWARSAQRQARKPKPVPPKLLFPLLEGASYESDDSIQEMWAGLLATAADMNEGAHARPGFISVLKQMSPDEASLLNWMADHASTSPEPVTLRLVYAAFIRDTGRKLTTSAFRGCIEELAAIQLIRLSDLATRIHNLYIGEDAAMDTPMKDPYNLTHRGMEFVTACRFPRTKRVIRKHPRR